MNGPFIRRHSTPRLAQQALMAMPEAGGVSQMTGVHGFGGAGGGRFAGNGGGMGAGGGAQGEPLRVTIANPNAMKQNVRARVRSVFHPQRAYEI